jgi:hypothetical protein
MKLLIAEKSQEEEHTDKREPYLLIAVKDDGNGVILESHSEGIEWLRDGIDNEDFFEAYCNDAPTEIGVYEWRGKIGSTRSFEGEIDYHLNGEWTSVWKRES